MKELQLGKCPICGTEYFEKTIRKGSDVLSEKNTIVTESNYFEIFLVLNSLSLTRMSFCTAHVTDLTDAQVSAAFQMLRSYMIRDIEANDPVKMEAQLLMWNNVKLKSWHRTEKEALAKMYE